jgi:predicted TPR repeat methyltransferase
MEDARRCYEQVLINATPEIYDQFADSFDEFVVKQLNATIWENVAKVWASYHPSTEEDHKVFDAGCGTGRNAEGLRKFNSSVKIYGGDFSPGMIRQTLSKNIYADLQVVDLNKELPYEPGSFDSIVCTGVFIPGHCGPECLPNILRILKRDCYFIATLRKGFYEEVKVEWFRILKECNATQVEVMETSYQVESTGVIAIIKKN